MTWFSILKEQKVGIRIDIFGIKELDAFRNELQQKYSKNYEKKFRGESKKVKTTGQRIPKRTLESLERVPSKKTMEQRLGREAISSLNEVSSKIREAPSKSKEWLSWLKEMGLEERPSPQRKPSKRTLEERMSREEIISYLKNRGEKIPEFEDREAEENFYREFTLTQEEYLNRPEVKGPLQRLKELNELKNEQEEEFFITTEGKTYQRDSFLETLLRKIYELEIIHKEFIESLESLNLEIGSEKGASAQKGGRVRINLVKPMPSKEIYGQRLDLQRNKLVSQFKKNGKIMEKALEYIEDVEFELDQINDLTIEIQEILEDNELELENEPVVLRLETKIFDIKE